MSRDKQKLVPRLRFTEFRGTEGWRIRPLSDLLQESRTRNRDSLYGPEHVLSVSGEFGCVNQIELLGRSYAGVSVKEYHVVESGDVVYTKSPLKRNPFGIIKANKGAPGIVSTLYAVYSPTEEGFAEFIDCYFGSDFRLNSYLQPIVRKGAKNDMKVNNAAVLTGTVCAPSVPEQQEIAACGSSLDDLIAAEGQKLDALKTHKKSLMQQVFPREGETVPRLRFPEFRGAGEWAIGPLSRDVELVSGLHLSPDDYSESGEVPYFTGPSDFTDDVSACVKWTARSTSVARLGDSVITVKGSGVGELLFLAIDEVAMGRQLMSVRPVTVDNRFLFHYLTTQRQRLNALATGNLIPGLARGDILGLQVPLPKKSEQAKIASFLSSLDEGIAAQAKKIDALKAHKKGLMQGLFPAIPGDAD